MKIKIDKSNPGEEVTKCDFCGKEGNWKNVLRDKMIEKENGSDLILCDNCIKDYVNKDFDKLILKLKRKQRRV